MSEIEKLLENNRAWAAGVRTADPDFFEELSKQQSPKYLWIGCADSRVPANQIMNLQPGAVFVHRNIANVVANADCNCLSVLQYAVEVLKVEHVIVCGHYGCGGVAAAMSTQEFGLIDQWLRNIKNVYLSHQAEVDGIEDENARKDRLCELNVMAQALNVASTTIVQNAWADGQKLEVHGVIYSLKDGLLKELGVNFTSSEQLPKVYQLHT